MSDWEIFTGRIVEAPTNRAIDRLPPPPPWRKFATLDKTRGQTYQASPREVEAVNAALYLRRPLLVTGKPGSGKSSLAYAVAEELGLAPVLRWSINSRSTLAEGLYQYDAIARLREANLQQLRGQADAKGIHIGADEQIGRFIRLGPLGTALLPLQRPRVLLIDEIDKSDIDLPNDLLHVFEEGRFEIPELIRIADEIEKIKVMPLDGAREEDRVEIIRGRVRCEAFPFVLITSNGERELPPAFNRRCLRLALEDADRKRLEAIIKSHLGQLDTAVRDKLIDDFVKKQDNKELIATDQLLNTLFLITRKPVPDADKQKDLIKMLMEKLG
ncbi:MAG TPA: MoxR family ATPase [Isosphaeraceae bacterium]|nr:MoxR family ATPase [Isosphaeraceae bacterium]